MSSVARKPATYWDLWFTLGNLQRTAIRPDLPFTSRFVLHLLQKLQEGCPAEGRHLYTDRFYTGVDLAAELLMKTHTTGTIMSNRKNLPLEVQYLTKFSIKKFKNMQSLL